MGDLFTQKDNEFIAWYPCCVTKEGAKTVWNKRRAAYYIHIPFCTTICDYCGFAVARLKDSDVQAYVAALQMEIERYGNTHRLDNYRFDCGHFGGGTPSVLDAKDLLSIKKQIENLFEVADDAEITVEVNPISFTSDKSLAYRDGGINRISFGVQSFHNRLLRIIGRCHRTHDVEKTLKSIKLAKYDNFSIDLIYGIPSQTQDELREDLSRAVDSGATHLSCFRLEIIPFTILKLREAAGEIPQRLSLEELNCMDDIVRTFLGKRGYREYGVFNFVRPGFESVHNDIAFIAPQDEYIGFGNSSYSFINDHVYCNFAEISTYIDAVLAGRDPIAFARKVNAIEEMSRYFVLGVKFLRVSRTNFIEKFGLEPEDIFGGILQRLQAEGMIIQNKDDYVLTPLGRNYINNVCKEFYVGKSRGLRQHFQFVPTLTPKRILHYANLISQNIQETKATTI